MACHIERWKYKECSCTFNRIIHKDCQRFTAAPPDTEDTVDSEQGQSCEPYWVIEKSFLEPICDECLLEELGVRSNTGFTQAVNNTGRTGGTGGSEISPGTRETNEAYKEHAAHRAGEPLGMSDEWVADDKSRTSTIETSSSSSSLILETEANTSPPVSRWTADVPQFSGLSKATQVLPNHERLPFRSSHSSAAEASPRGNSANQRCIYTRLVYECCQSNHLILVRCFCNHSAVPSLDAHWAKTKAASPPPVRRAKSLSSMDNASTTDVNSFQPRPVTADDSQFDSSTMSATLPEEAISRKGTVPFRKQEGPKVCTNTDVKVEGQQTIANVECEICTIKDQSHSRKDLPSRSISSEAGATYSSGPEQDRIVFNPIVEYESVPRLQTPTRARAKAFKPSQWLKHRMSVFGLNPTLAGTAEQGVGMNRQLENGTKTDTKAVEGAFMQTPQSRALPPTPEDDRSIGETVSYHITPPSRRPPSPPSPPSPPDTFPKPHSPILHPLRPAPKALPAMAPHPSSTSTQPRTLTLRRSISMGLRRIGSLAQIKDRQ